jgi:hypothetical protein
VIGLQHHRFFKGCLVGIGLAAASAGSAFDTGTHFEVTGAALADLGFSQFAVDTARLENWLVDFYSQDFTYPQQAEVELMHFDNRTGSAPAAQSREVRVYWGHFTNNMRRGIQKIATSGSPTAAFDAVCLLGMSLHMVQDFYAHSTWVESHPGPADGYRTDTWFTNTPGPNDTSVYTGRYPGGDPTVPADGLIYHGSYSWGVNKDNFNRPLWDRALVFSYSATVQWVLAVRKWCEEVSPGFYAQMQALNIPTYQNDLNYDLDALRYLSTWVWTGDTDGRWKAKGSGQAIQFGHLTQIFVTGHELFGDPFIWQFKATGGFLFRQLTPNLDNLTGLIPSYQPLPVPRLNRRAIYLRTLSVADTTPLFSGGGVDGPGGRADFYALHSIFGQKFLETMRPDTSSGPVDWLTVKLVPSGRMWIPIKYELWDEDIVAATLYLGGTDDHVDINPASNKYDLVFDFNTGTHACRGDITGVHDSVGTAASSSGNEGLRADIQFYITEYAVSNP